MRNLAHLRLLSTAEVARRLEVTPQTVARFVRDGKLSAATRGPGIRGPLLFDPETVEEYRAERSDEATR